MLKRLLIGFLKGALLGAGLGAAVHVGLGWTDVSSLLGYLLAMGAGGTAGVITGRPPWHQEAWVEGVLKAAVGVGVGALLYWLLASFADVPVGGLVGADGTTLARVPLLYLPPIAALYGSLVELDNTGEEGEGEPRAKGRGASDDEEDGAEVPSAEGRRRGGL